jgi:hypothetical protein
MGINLGSLCAEMVALSVAVERVVEIIKQFCGSWPVLKLLFTPRATQSRENMRCACMYILSGTIGGVIAGRSGIAGQLLPGAHPHTSYIVAGLLSSGGSAFWNHVLDLLQATKVSSEQAAANAVSTAAAVSSAAEAAVVIGGMPSP